MSKKLKYGLFILAFAAIFTLTFLGVVMSDVEQARYKTVQVQGGIEIRDYAPMIIAEVEVVGEQKEAINKGFRIIADFIFGNNAVAKEIAMTAPVIQQAASEKIAMTAPVIQQAVGDKWKVRFVMPANYTMQTLPKPNNSAIVIKEEGIKRFAAIRFSGIASAEKLAQKTKELESFLLEQKIQAKSVATFAFFNPPWTLPFFRRNEVMIEITK